MAITQTITTLPAAPDPATMTRDEFSAAAAAYVAAQKDMVPELNTWAEEVNTIAGTAVGDVATAIGAAGADTPVDADKFTFRQAASGLLKSVTLAGLKSLFAAVAGSATQDFAAKILTLDNLLKMKTGANIASAATINLSTATGNLVHITGTTATSAVTMTAGQWMRCIADAAWPLTYHATTNRISGGASYTLTAGDTVDYFYDGTTVIGNITKKDGTALAGTQGKILQVVRAALSTPTSGSTIIPFDTSIPQVSEGTQMLSCAVTPLSASSILLVMVNLNGVSANAANNVTGALFKDGAANAVAAGHFVVHLNAYTGTINIPYSEASGSTAARTFTVRVGANAATWYLNGHPSYTLGGKFISEILILEVAP